MEYVIKEKIFHSVNISSIIISFIISITLLVVIFRSIKIISVVIVRKVKIFLLPNIFTILIHLFLRLRLQFKR